MPVSMTYLDRFLGTAKAEEEELGVAKMTGSPSSQRLLGESETESKEEMAAMPKNGSAVIQQEQQQQQQQKDYEAPHKAVINECTDDEMIISGFRRVTWKWCLCGVAMIATAGLLWLLLYWVPRWKLWWTHEAVSLSEADAILVEERYKKDYRHFYVKHIHILQTVSGEDPVEIPVPSRTGTGYRAWHRLRYFNCKKQLYIWDWEEGLFYALRGLDQEVPSSHFYSQSGLSPEDQWRRRLVYGPNDILVPYHSVAYLLVKEVLNPFYVFQVASVILWTADEYYYYAAAIVIMSAGGVISAVYQTRQNQENLRSTIQSTNNVKVKRNEDIFEIVASDSLVPGDVIVVPPDGCEMTCDAVLILGTAIVNEAMLTGESVPVTKTHAPRTDDIFDAREHQRHTLFRGTTVIQTRSNSKHANVLAVVIRTGFLTTKGNLVRSIMFPAPVDFKFEQESYKFVGFLTLIAGIGFAYTCYRLISEGDTSAGDIFLEAADLITIVIPPALPAAMTIGSLYAQKRLQKKGIFCISPRTINVSGSIDCVCFDKTGTLTEDGLDMLGIVQVDHRGNNPANHNDIIQFEPMQSEMKSSCTSSLSSPFIAGMSTCHSLTVIEDKLTGDPMDLKMFEFTNWSLEEARGNWLTIVKPPPVSSTPHKASTAKDDDVSDQITALSDEIGIVRQFQFSSDRQCMSVIVRGLSAKHYTIYCKGSPEKVKSLAKPNSIPANFQEELDKYTERGYRVIALGTRDLPSNLKMREMDHMDKSEVEKDLDFLGFIIFENRIKKETLPVIERLQRANLRTIMVTGDHIQTALSVARECKMIPPSGRIILLSASSDANTIFFEDKTLKSRENNSSTAVNVDYQFATDGKTFQIIRNHHPALAQNLFTRGAVFARMSPDQKETLVEELQSLDYYVGMCGDGANDCGALKGAHAGISLSEAEASVASPFTSKEPNISCVPELIREGRCALVTSFGIFKYMAGYSLTQFCSVLILYDFGTNLSDLQFLYIDLFLITVFAFFFGLTQAYPGELAEQPPKNSLIHFFPISSLLLQMVAMISFQVAGLFYTKRQDWFVPFNGSNPGYTGSEWETYYNQTTIDGSEYACWENYSVFTISAFQYIILAYVFSKSKPYRKMVVTNLQLMVSFVFLTSFTIFVVLGPTEYLQRSLELFLPPVKEFRWLLLSFVALNALLSICLEDFCVEVLLQKLVQGSLHRKNTRYAICEEWMRQNTNWPPLSEPPPEQRNTEADTRNVVTVEVMSQSADEQALVRNFNFASPQISTGNNDAHTSAAVALNGSSSTPR